MSKLELAHFLDVAEVAHLQMLNERAIENLVTLYRHVGSCKVCAWGTPKTCSEFRLLEAKT